MKSGVGKKLYVGEYVVELLDYEFYGDYGDIRMNKLDLIKSKLLAELEKGDDIK